MIMTMMIMSSFDYDDNNVDNQLMYQSMNESRRGLDGQRGVGQQHAIKKK